MAPTKTVLVTGAAGFIGSHSVLELLNAGYEIVALDNFVNSAPNGKKALSLVRVEKLSGKEITFYQVDATNKDQLENVFKKHKIDCVIHFAALKAVGKSVEMPLEFYKNNLVSTVVLLETMKKYHVYNLVFSSSMTVYGQPQQLPVDEDHPIGQGITNPYGHSKYFIEQILQDLCKAEAGWNIIILRYFNPAGAHPSGLIGEDPKGTPNNIMPYIAKVAIGTLPHVVVLGDDYDTCDGTGVRDYVHVVDLAHGHVAALKKFEQGNIGIKVYNLGLGRGYSVLELIQAMEKAMGKKVPYEICPRRDGDVGMIYCDPTLAMKDLGWNAKLGLDEMCRDFWNWQQSNPHGFQENGLH